MSELACFFGPDLLPLFGWLHGLVGAQHDVGIVLCSPWGREEVSAHRSLRQWALCLAAAGWPCIRFDYAGEGDSAGDPLNDGGVDAWVQSARAAAEELKRRAGVTRLCFLGIRSGATVACLAAQGRDDVVGMVAVAPVVKGRGFVRELTALHAATNKRGELHALPGTFQSGGYVMSEATRDALAAVDLAQLPAAPAPFMLVLDRDDMPPSAAWQKALAASGAHVTQRSLPGYVGMMADPHHVVAPQAMIDATASWLSEVIRPLSARRASASFSLVGAPSAQALIPLSGRSGAMVQEQALVIPGTPAFGILSSPAVEATRSGHAILLLNAGSTRRIGSSRMSVDQARRWASQGHVVLRLDLAGIGDSNVRPGRPLNMSYPNEAMLDVKAAFDYLQHAAGVRKVHACGLCAGAYHALKAARDGVPFQSITLINPLVYFNAEGLTLEDEQDLSPQKVHSAAASYKAAVGSLDKWLKLLKGQVQVGVLMRVFAKRLGMTIAVRVRNLARAVHWPLTDDLGTELRRLTASGMRVQFVFAKGDPGEIMLREMAGSLLESLQRQGRLSVRIFDEADHVFTDLGLRGDMMAYLDQALSSIVVDADAEPLVPVRPVAVS